MITIFSQQKMLDSLRMDYKVFNWMNIFLFVANWCLIGKNVVFSPRSFRTILFIQTLKLIKSDTSNASDVSDA